MGPSARCRKLYEMVRPFGELEDNCASRLRRALTMMSAGIDMMRLNLQRQHLDDSSPGLLAQLDLAERNCGHRRPPYSRTCAGT